MAKNIRPEGIATNLDEAKKRCRDCGSLVEWAGEWICDQAGCPIQDIKECGEWEDGWVRLEASHDSN